MDKILKRKDIEKTVKAQSLEYEQAGSTWTDGLLLGNGNIGAVAYAPNSMEWVINKLDVYDGRVRNKLKQLPHDEVMAYMKEHGIKDSFFLDELEMPKDNISPYSISPLILKLHLGDGELGWAAEAFPNISQRLSIFDGVLYQKADAHFMHTEIKSITPRGTDLFLTRICGCSVFDKNHMVEVFRPYHEDMDKPVWEQNDNGELYFVQSLPDGKNHYAVGVKVVAREPDINRINYTLPSELKYKELKPQITGVKHTTYNGNIYCIGDFDIFVCVSSSHSEENPLACVKKKLNEAVAKGYDAFEEENKQWWKSYWERSAADFGENIDIQKYFYFSMYELACSFEKAPMPTLNGLCCGPVSNEKSGVNCPFYTHDQNAQMPSMPLLALNHVELMKALTDTYFNVADVLKENTKRLFGKSGGEGIFLPLAMTQDGVENPSGSYRYTLCGGAYTGLVLSLIWKFTHDTELVREKIYPLLCGFITFYTKNILTMADDGKYHMDLSVPPEIFTMTRDDAATLSMLKTCIISAIEISDAIGDANPDVNDWKDILEHYPDISKRADGAWWSGPDIPKEHFCFGGHLMYPFFPSEAYVTSEDKISTKKTLEFIGKNAIERSFADTDGGFHYLHDWSWCLTSMAQLRTSQENFFEELRRGLSYFAKPNGLFSHDSIVIGDIAATEANYSNAAKSEGYSTDPGRSLYWYELGRCATSNKNAKRLASPVLEGNSIFLMCAIETLLQSYDGIIRLFPGVPKNFSGCFQSFLAQGGFEVSAKMEQGQLTKLHIKSNHGGKLKLYNPLHEKNRVIELESYIKDGEKVYYKEMKTNEELSIEL